MASPTEAKYSSIDGVPLYYWRTSDGEPVRVYIYSTYEFRDRLVEWMQNLKKVSGRYGSDRYRSVRRVVTAGAYVNRSGQHGEGTAFDLDQVKWSEVTCTPYWQQHAHKRRFKRRRYLAVDAICRRHFRYVLDGWYNSAHEDHIHFDFGGLPTVCRTGSESDTVFVQSLCNDFIDAGLVVDGVWGAKTTDAFEESKRLLGVRGDPHRRITAWRNYLNRAAAHGFANRSFGYFSF